MALRRASPDLNRWRTLNRNWLHILGRNMWLAWIGMSS